jgi:hypothetical protein
VRCLQLAPNHLLEQALHKAACGSYEHHINIVVRMVAPVLIAIAAEHDAKAPHSMCAWLGTVRRYETSRAREAQSVRIQVTLQAGQKGTKKLMAQHGQQLVCVRYRYDVTHQWRLKTVDLTVEETPWRSERAAHRRAKEVQVHIDF